MRHPMKRQKTFFSIVILIFLFQNACGVKGKPLPPEKPVPIGTGKYNYKKATEGIKVKRKEDESKDKDGELELEDGRD